MTDLVKKIFVAGLVLVVVGCAQEASRPGDLPGSTAGVGKVSPDAALVAAEKVLTRHGYQIQSVDTATGTVVTVPREYTAKEGATSISDLFSPSAQTFRKIATAHVTPLGADGASVSVRVDVQRRDTKARQNFAAQRQGDDRPNNTPVFQNAGVDREKSEVWTPIRRDTDEEERLVGEIKSCLQTKTP